MKYKAEPINMKPISPSKKRDIALTLFISGHPGKIYYIFKFIVYKELVHIVEDEGVDEVIR